MLLKNVCKTNPTSITAQTEIHLSPKLLSTLSVLCNLLKEVLQKQNIDVSKYISDSADGASNMPGQYNGFTTFREKESSDHIDTSCCAHVLNFVLRDVTTTNHASISLFGLVQRVGLFFGLFFHICCEWTCGKSR